MVCQLPGDFLTLDFHTNDFGDLLASREDAKRRRKTPRRKTRRRKTKAQTSHKNWTTGSMRNSTCRFESQRRYGPYVKSFGSPKQRSQKFLGSGLLGGFA